MRKCIFAAAALAGMVVLPVTEVSAQSRTLPSPTDSDASRITISCFRGIVKDVIWDRPNAVFVDDLTQLGYSYPTAHAIAERVCRDEYGVRNPEHQAATLLEILAETPPR